MRVTQTKIVTAEATQVPFLNFLAAVIIISQPIFRSLHVISLGFRKLMKKQNFCCIAWPMQGLPADLGTWWLPHNPLPPQQAAQQPGKRPLSPACAAMGENTAICPRVYGYFLPAEP